VYSVADGRHFGHVGVGHILCQEVRPERKFPEIVFRIIKILCCDINLFPGMCTSWRLAPQQGLEPWTP
jgi:hypothetical protein